MRIRYSCTANLEEIRAQNQKVLNKNTKTESQCNYAGSCKYPLKGATAVRKTLFIGLQSTLTLRQDFTSACVLLYLDSDMSIIKILSKVACMEMTLKFHKMFAA